MSLLGRLALFLADVVVQSLKNYLADEAGLLQEMPAHGHPASGLANARAFKDALEADPAGSLHQLLLAVLVDPQSLTLQLDLRGIWGSGQDDAPKKRLVIPIQLQRKGLAVKLVLSTPDARSNTPDPKLIRLVNRAHQLAMQFISGKVQTIQALAQTEGVTSSYISRLIPIGLLAPDILQAIVQGKQPMSLTIQKLLNTGALPLAWADQEQVLGFEKDTRL